MMPIAVLGAGMMTGVGFTAPAACAAMRAAISAFDETDFTFRGGEPVIGCVVPFDKPWRGIDKLAQLVVPAIQECLRIADPAQPEAIPLLLCVAEKERPGRLDELDDELLPKVLSSLGVQFHRQSTVIARGRVGGAVALDLARRLIQNERVPRCLIAGVDSFLVGPTIAAYEAKHRLLTADNSNGFIPGEAGAAALVGAAGSSTGPELRCVAIGFGQEKASIESEEPLRADGLVEALRAMKADGGVTLDDADYRYSDCNGEQYAFKDDRLAITRVMRKLKDRFDHLHPADSVGEIGAAVGPCVLGMALAAARKNYAPGRGVWCHFSGDEGDRASVLLRYGEKGGDR